MKKTLTLLLVLMILLSMVPTVSLATESASDDCGENPYYTDVSSEISQLAPGITQEIRKATSADGKQMVYYLATADLSNSYVTVNANYYDDEPTEWAMARVLDQANTAQAKYGDPESVDYIENYQIVAAINSDGFNMATGAPGGLLVMHGTEYHAPNSNGFFGITLDGEAVIGTTEEYNTIYKGKLRDAVGAFGTTLVKDGKVNITASSDYYNDRASRTAVGITKTGKVVFMVLDGRQEPVSCGGSMIEIAQIMLEAGCVEAINLDGGGSSTFVSKPEGQDELQVTNSPSDGYARTVSSTLIMVSTAPSTDAYRIEVNGTVFDSTTSTSGDGWSYDPSRNRLNLRDYVGGSIYASGDLTIYNCGESYILGSDGTNYGADAICVDGTLKLRNYGSELGIMGGSGDLSGGDGIYVGEDFYLTSYGDTYIFGGDTGNSTSSSGNNLWGGYAVLVGGSASFSGSSYSTVYAVGGKSGVNDEHSVDGSFGGYALAAYEDITVEVPFAFLGGEANAGGPAVYCGGTCTFGAVDGYLYSGDGPYYYKALICDNAPVYSEHTNVVYSPDSDFPYAIQITRKTYTLDLYGAGGTYNGESKVSLSAKYPSSHTLSNYLFQREGYVQVAWAIASDLIPLNRVYQPTGDAAFVAHWLAAEKGDIVLNALSGTFDSDGSMYQKYSTEVQLPSEVTFSNDSILAWCDEITPVADLNSYIYSGRWYACGDTVSPDPESVTQLYAQRTNSGQYAIYHLNGGQSAEGGTLLVQGGYAATHDLTVYTPSASDITAPEGYEFNGWYIPETDTYLDENAPLDLKTGSVSVYAQWDYVGCEMGHVYDQQVATDDYKATNATCTRKATFYYSCLCGEKGTETFEYGSELGHSFTNYCSNGDATCTEDGTKTAICDRECGERSTVTDVDSRLEHVYDQQVIADDYKAVSATCTTKATYYYSCHCGEKGTETFEHGAELGHSFTNYVSDGNASCLEDGTKTAKCDNSCEETHTVADVGSLLGHTFINYVSDSNATCTADGTKTAICDRGCGETDSVIDVGSMLGHSFTDYVSDGNASCTADGTKSANCDRGCGERSTVTDVDSRLEHVFDQQVIADDYEAASATCTTKATFYYSCLCGERGTEAFEHGAELGHSFTNYVSDGNASCLEDGTKTAKCDNGCEETHTVADVGSLLGHTFINYVSDSNATCTADGTKTAICDRGCGETESVIDVGSMLGHSFTNYVSDGNASCTADGTKSANCDRGCGERSTVTDVDSRLEHVFDQQVIADDYKAASATCTTKATFYYSCLCGERGTEAFEHGAELGHSFTNYVSDGNASCTLDGTKTARCDHHCGETDTVADVDSRLEHVYDQQAVTDDYKATNATCTTKATFYYSCICGEKGTETFECGSELGHSFTNYCSNSDATCTEDGTKTAICDRECGETDSVIDVGSMLGHSFTNYVSDGNASCTADGTKSANCDRGCGERSTVTDVDSRLEHVFDQQVIDDDYKAVNATCTTKATFYYSCLCGERGTETFEHGAELGHSFTNYVSDGNASCLKDGTKTAKCDNGCEETHTVADVGSLLGHTFINYVSDGNATCMEDGTKTAKCNNGCGETHTVADVGSLLGHTFINYVSDSNATCTADGTKTAICENGCGETHTILDEGSVLGHVYGQVSYAGDGKTSYVATRSCSCGDTQADTAIISQEETKPATCEEIGIRTYFAVFSAEWAADSVVTEEIAKLGHNYGAAEFVWQHDYSAVTVTVSCVNCEDGAEHKEVTADCGITSVWDEESKTLKFVATAQIGEQTFVDDTHYIKVRLEDEKLTLDLSLLEAETKAPLIIMVASYENSGKMTGVQVVYEAVGMTEINMTISGDYFRVFFLKSGETAVPAIVSLLI